MAKPSRRERERQTRQEEIVDAAERIFGRSGFEAASMDEIAREAQFTKRTIYQYFANKEDLFYAVRLKERRQFFARLQEAVAGGGTGLERIRRAAAAFYGFYRDEPEAFRQMSYSERIDAGAAAGSHRQELMRLGAEMFREMGAVLAAGMADGSIRADLDARLAAPAVAFILNGFFHMLAESGEAFVGMLGLDREKFVACAVDLIVDALRAG